MNFDFENTIYENKTVILENVVNENTKDNLIPSVWDLEIPKIGLKANIEESTTDEVLNRNIGHFIESEYIDGNVALASHNRGYEVNYFGRLKELDIGDKVIYTYGDIIREYEVISKDIIKDTNVEVLDNTKNKDNILTLITCVEDMPELRRCIKCAEIK